MQGMEERIPYGQQPVPLPPLWEMSKAEARRLLACLEETPLYLVRKCGHCDAEFEQMLVPYRHRSERRRYCSVRCREAASVARCKARREAGIPPKAQYRPTLKEWKYMAAEGTLEAFKREREKEREAIIAGWKRV